MSKRAIQDYTTLWPSDGSLDFNAKALAIFQHQLTNCDVYRRFCESIKCTNVTRVEDIPHLPISLFKQHTISSTSRPVERIFKSSGTSGMTQSAHHVSDLSLYEASYLKGFERVYGSVSDWCILALLPSYLERSDSSLVYMVDGLIKQGAHAGSGFYLDNTEALRSALLDKQRQGIRSMLIGVTYALLDFVEAEALNMPELTIMETGGMKGRREELTRQEVHERLCAGFRVPAIHSEYGMTELLSQAYSTGKGLFKAPPWMRISIRQSSDPLSTEKQGRTGGINVMDLANMDSCAFIATDDLGRLHSDGQFEVLGRFDQSDVRGCSLLSL